MGFLQKQCWVSRIRKVQKEQNFLALNRGNFVLFDIIFNNLSLLMELFRLPSILVNDCGKKKKRVIKHNFLSMEKGVYPPLSA